MDSLYGQSFSLLHCVQTGFEDHHPTNTEAICSGEKWPVLEADHTLPANTEVNRSYISLPYVSSWRGT
jgi:hypothetical protein